LKGETEWTKNGRYTGITELKLTNNGVKQVRESARILIRPEKVIGPRKLAHVFISPRKRAQTTFDLLFGGIGEETLLQEKKVTTTEELAEWDYGKYEGLLTEEIRARRKELGLDKESPWDIWRDGCEDGE
jgi:broad specificity phosphatase PhoE